VPIHRKPMVVLLRVSEIGPASQPDAFRSGCKEEKCQDS
jgi:hypothetical protein